MFSQALCHWRTFIDWSWSHSFVILAVCSWSLSCWKMNFLPNSVLHSALEWAVINDACTLLHSFFLHPCLVSRFLLPITSLSTEQCWNSVRVMFRFLLTSLTLPPRHQQEVSWRCQTSLMMMEATVLVGPSVLQIFFLFFFLHNPVSEVCRQSHWLHGLFCALTFL